MKDRGVFSLLALRANIGTTGNQNFTQNQSRSMYTYLKPVYGNMFGTSISVLGNPDLECQTTFNRNVGLELTVLKGLLNLDMNYYYNTTEGSLTSVTIAPSIGFSELKVNQGDIVNKGIDFSLSVTPVRTKEMLFSVTFNGRPVSIDRLAGYVAAERAKLPESDRADMQVLLTSDASGSPAALVGKTVTFGAAGQLEVLRSDRAYPSDVRTMIFAGNVQARFRDETPDPALKDVLTEIRCDSLVVNPAGRNFECFDAGFSNASMLSFGKWYRFLADDSGLGWSREMENVMETSLNTALIQVLPDGNILLNGGPVSVAELEPKLVAWRGERSPADVGAWIIAGKEAKMGVVTDIKQALRAANILRVMYNGTDERMVMRMLPPRSASSPGVNVVADVLAVVPGSAAGEDSSTVRSEIRVRERNVFLVLLNGNGKMMVGTADALELIDPRELTSRVGAFVRNVSDDPGLAEKVVTEFDLPGGGKMEYPVSQGIVSLQTASDTPFDSYLDVQNRIAQAFDDIRTHLAQRQFGKPYGELSDAQRQVVMRAVPLKISEAEPHVSR